MDGSLNPANRPMLIRMLMLKAFANGYSASGGAPNRNGPTVEVAYLGSLNLPLDQFFNDNLHGNWFHTKEFLFRHPTPILFGVRPLHDLG